MIFSICDEGPCRAVELRRADSRRLIGEISGDSSAPEEEGMEEEEEEVVRLLARPGCGGSADWRLEAELSAEAAQCWCPVLTMMS